MIEHIRDTEEEQDKWKWMHSTPNAILFFCDNQDVFFGNFRKSKEIQCPTPNQIQCK